MKMAISLSKTLTTLSIFLFFTTSSFALNPPTPLQSFTNCFMNKTLTSTQLLYTSTSPSYQSILQSSAQNLRFLVSPTNQKPAAIVTATAESHVSAAVVCARAHGIQLRTRSGGHDYEAMSYVSDGKQPQLFAVVDLAALREVDVDTKSRTAWVQAGATLGELYYNVFTRTNGTAGFPAGICPTVGVGGHVSGGGIGTLTRKFGLAADNVIDARVVGVDGRVLDRRAMGEDLFWAVRGGGAASFGVVVAYRIKLVDVPPVVTVFNVNRNLRQNATKLVTR